MRSSCGMRADPLLQQYRALAAYPPTVFLFRVGGTTIAQTRGFPRASADWAAVALAAAGCDGDWSADRPRDAVDADAVGRSHPEGRKRSGLHHDLDAAVLLVPKGLVQFRPLFKGCPVGDDEGRIDLAFLDALQKLRQIVLHRSLGHAEGEAAVDRGA